MTDNSKIDPVAYQRGLCPPAFLDDLDRSRIPSPERFFCVALGLADWTEDERRLIKADARLAAYEEQMRLTAVQNFGRPAVAVWPSPNTELKLTPDLPAHLGLLAAKGAGAALNLVNTAAKVAVRLFRNN